MTDIQDQTLAAGEQKQPQAAAQAEKPAATAAKPVVKPQPAAPAQPAENQIEPRFVEPSALHAEMKRLREEEKWTSWNA